MVAYQRDIVTLVLLFQLGNARLQPVPVAAAIVGDLGCRLGPERRQVRKQMALRFPSPFHDVGRRRVPAAGEVESGWRRGAVVIRTILFQRFTGSLCLSTSLSCSSQNGCQVQQLSSVSSMSKVSRQLSSVLP